MRGQSNKDVQKYEDLGDGLKVSDLSVPKGEDANVIVKSGDRITVDMVGRLSGWNGQVFLKTTDKSGFSEAPLSFKVGAGEVIPGLERGVIGMKKGAVRRVVIPPGLGYPRPTTFDLLGKPGYLPDPGLSSESTGQPWELRNRLVNGVLMNSEREDTLVIDVKVRRVE